MTRQEHLAWCKNRALELLDAGNLENAFASMCSDLGKHPETQGHLGIELGTMLLLNGHLNNDEQMRDWITGFN